MKKIGIVALSLFGFASMLEAAELKFSGDFRVRGIYSDNLYDADDSTTDAEAFADGRFRLKIAATAGITSGVVVVDFTDSFSDPTNALCVPPPGGTGCGTGNYRFGSANFGGDYHIVGVREAHLKLDLGRAKLALGRKQFKLGHGLVLDDTFDAIAAKTETGAFDVMLALGKLRESNVTTSGHTGSDADLYLTKVDVHHGGGETDASRDEHRLGLFTAYLKDRNPFKGLGPVFLPSTDSAEMWAGGLSADARFGAITAQFEVDVLGGEINLASPASDVDVSGLNVLLGGGVDVGSSANVGLTLLHTRGQEFDKSDTDWNVNGISGNYVLGNILVNDNLRSDRDGMCASVRGGRFGSGGAGCLLGLGITAVKLAVNLPDMTPNCDADVAVIWARSTEAISPVLNERDLGVEVDFNTVHRLDEHVNIALNFGYLFAGDFFKVGGANPGDDVLKAVASVNYVF